MAVLNEADRVGVWRKGMQENIDEYSLTKVELRAFYDAVDVWVQDNKVAFNNALPAAAKAALSAAQKAKGLSDVALARFGAGI